jgi:chitodextrinase
MKKTFVIYLSFMAIFLFGVVNFVSAQTVTDTIPPTVPLNLNVVADVASPYGLSSSVRLAWLSSTDNQSLRGYKIYKNGVLLTETTLAYYTYEGPNNETYFNSFTVSAYDASGNESARSVPASAYNQQFTGPRVVIEYPRDGFILYGSSTLLGSAYMGTRSVGIKVQFRIDGVNVGTEMNGGGLSSTLGWNSATVPNGFHVFTIAARDADGNTSNKSVVFRVENPSGLTSSLGVPTVPTNIISSATTLSWLPSKDDVAVTGYKVYKNGVYMTSTTSTTNVSGSSYGMPPAGFNTYTISAYDAAGNQSGMSAPSTETPQTANQRIAIYRPYAGHTISGNPVAAGTFDLIVQPLEQGTMQLRIDGVNYEAEVPVALSQAIVKTIDTRNLSNGLHIITAAFKGTNTADNDSVAIFVNNPAPTPASAFTFPTLKVGNNLLALPLEPADPKIDAILAPIAGKYSKVSAFNSSGSSSYYDPVATYHGTLLDLHAGQGFTITMTQEATLTVAGSYPVSTFPALSNNLTDLSTPGRLWSFVGPTTPHPIDVRQALGNTKIGMLYTYGSPAVSGPAGSNNTIMFPDDFTSFEPGRGYWLTTEPMDFGLPYPVSGYMLPAGWNFLSFTLEPADPNIDALFASIAGKYDRITSTDPITGEAVFYSPSTPTLNTLRQLHAGQGFMIKMNTSVPTFKYKGYTADTIFPFSSLRSGAWNEVGPTSVRTRSVSEIMSNYPFSSIYTYKAPFTDATGETDKLYYPTDFTTFSGGKGYWINLNSDAAPAPTPIQLTGWTWCSYEGGLCNITGTKEVQFGVNGQYKTKIVTGTVDCTWSVFGDPAPGSAKQCWYRDVPGTSPAACTNLNFVSGSVRPDSVVALNTAVASGSDYSVACDYGAAGVDSINPVVGSGSCTYSAFVGTTAYFNCRAGSVAGTFSNYCTVTPGTNSNNCARRDAINNITTTPLDAITYGCGSASGQTYATAPTANLCLLGVASTVTKSVNSTWTWTCPGANGPSSYSCVAKVASSTPNTFDGACGTSHSKTLTTAPASTTLCAAGTATTPTLTGSEWIWKCNGTSGYIAGCWALKAPSATPTPGTVPTGDTTAPTTPTNLTAAVLSTTQIKLSWTPSTDNLAVRGYKIYKNGTLLYTYANTVTPNYTVSALIANTSYSFAVVAYDAANNTSSQATVSATTAALDTLAPTTPSNIAVWKTSVTTQVAIIWTPATDNVKVVGYRIYRNGVLLTSTPNNYYNVPLTTAIPYTYSVSAYDAAKNESPKTTTVTPTQYSTDTQAPVAPSGLTAAPSVTSVQLTWSASTDNSRVVGYKIYRNGVKIAATAGTSFKNLNLIPGTTYDYKVSSYDIAGNTSTESAVNSSTIIDTAAPTVPAYFTATGISTAQIKLTWRASTDNAKVTGYNIFRNGTKIATTAGVSYTNTALTPNTSYSYTVSAYDASGNTSAQTASVTARTLIPDTSSPTTPTNLTATPYSQTRINLSWSAATDNVKVAGYKIYRNAVLIGSTSTLTYASAGLVANTTYRYTVAAHDAAGNLSGQSATVSATTLP